MSKASSAKNMSIMMETTMRQIIAAVTRKLLLTIFAPVTVGLLITASASAEPKGSFELSATIPAIAMVNVTENGGCAGRNGDIGMSSAGLILSCQSDGSGRYSWRKSRQSAPLLFGGTYWYLGNGACYSNPVTNGCSCPSGYTAAGVSGSDYNKGRWDSWGYVCWRLP